MWIVLTKQWGNFSIYIPYSLMTQMSKEIMVYIHSKLFLKINTQWVLQYCCSNIMWIVLTKCFKHLVVVVFAKWQYSSVAYGAMPYVSICKVAMHFWMEEMPKCTCILALHKLRIMNTNNLQESTKKLTSHKLTSHPIYFTK